MMIVVGSISFFAASGASADNSEKTMSRIEASSRGSRPSAPARAASASGTSWPITGTIVFISHDRYFINRIATQVVEVDHGHLTTHLGTYDDYLDHKAAATASSAHAPAGLG